MEETKVTRGKKADPAKDARDAGREQDMFSHIPDPCVYCGPSVRGVARQYTTYQGGIPEALQTFLLEHPEALDLIVSTLRFPAMLKRLETPGTEEAML